MINTLINNVSEPTIEILPVKKPDYLKWLNKQPKYIFEWLNSISFDAAPGTRALIPGANGTLKIILFGISSNPTLWDWGKLPLGLAPGLYKLSPKIDAADAKHIALSWALETYRFNRYKNSKKPTLPILVKPDNFKTNEAASIYLVRDLINTPANDMGPDDLAGVARKLSLKYKAKFSVIIGEKLLDKGYPSIHTVGRAHDRPPRLIDIRWGKKNAPKLTVIGKGVCFDTGGLNLKSTPNMALMKKDMGGAAHALGLAQLIMQEKINVNLRVLIPAVENSVASNSMRPGDIIKTRKNITVEVGNTDAEGRLILADVLTEASSENPELIIDFATLTGAARIALGTELPAFFCNNEELAKNLLDASHKSSDPIWRMPLWQGYKSQIHGKVADLSNSGSSLLGGSITAALFLEHFVEPNIPWAHFDIMAWNTNSKPGRPEGGEAMGMRAVFFALLEKFKTNC